MPNLVWNQPIGLVCASEKALCREKCWAPEITEIKHLLQRDDALELVFGDFSSWPDKLHIPVAQVDHLLGEGRSALGTQLGNLDGIPEPGTTRHHLSLASTLSTWMSFWCLCLHHPNILWYNYEWVGGAEYCREIAERCMTFVTANVRLSIKLVLQEGARDVMS